jgi:phosphoribosylformimino-5-aminoimidazole carboxamide ribotide isomerase
MKILASIDLLDGQVVRLTKGEESKKVVYSNDPIVMAKRWASEGADMLHLVDLDAALDTGKDNVAVIEEIVKSTKIPTQIGGGLRTEERIDRMFEIGSARIVLGTFAYQKPNLVRRMTKMHPNRIVLSVDHRRGIVMIKGWKKSSDYSVADAISKFSKIGITDFLLTDIERDGTMEGPDIETINDVCSNLAINVIASGGISSLRDIIKIAAVGCGELILGKSLYEGRIELKKAKAIL